MSTPAPHLDVPPMRSAGDEATALETLAHERVIVRRGERSGLPVIIAVHSTRLGNAVGGCRMWTYASWKDGLADSLRLSEAMSLKCAAAGVGHGGGKSVIALPMGTVMTADLRVAAMQDLGDAVQDLCGIYIVGEDVGTRPEDMAVVRQRTAWAAAPPAALVGEEQTLEPTSVGVYEALKATAQHIFGSSDLEQRTMAIVGLGTVGEPLARRLASDGSRLVVSDIDESKREIAAEIGAQWVSPSDALIADVDIVVPAALGGILTATSVPKLRCRAVVGPANNQLTDDGVADVLAACGIVWAPDFIVNAGGVVWGVSTSLDGRTSEEALADVSEIGPRLASILRRSAETSRSPLAIAMADARSRLGGPIDVGTASVEAAK